MTERIWKAFVVGFGAIVISAVVAPVAHAGCGDIPSIAAHGGRLVPAAYHTGSGSTANDDHDGRNTSTIVGLWQFTFISQGNTAPPASLTDGSTLDAGYTAWHSDGTEIMNSSRDPATSSFCLGTWKLVGPNTYELNHVTLSWDNTGTFCTPTPPATSCMVGPGNIRETVTVSRNGKTYTGHVTIDQYDNTPQHNHMFRLTGTVSAKRILVN
jgi:hypothetical protein